MEPPDPIVLREALRQGERILTLQDAAQESVLRRAGELLRLAVAAIGGFIVVSGVLASIGISVALGEFVGLMVGFLLLVTSAGVAAGLLSGALAAAEFVHGPEMRPIVDHVRDFSIDEVALLAALLEAQPDAIEGNDRLIRQSKRMDALALLALATGTVVLLVAFVFVLGGPILA